MLYFHRDINERRYSYALRVRPGNLLHTKIVQTLEFEVGPDLFQYYVRLVHDVLSFAFHLFRKFKNLGFPVK